MIYFKKVPDADDFEFFEVDTSKQGVPFDSFVSNKITPLYYIKELTHTERNYGTNDEMYTKVGLFMFPKNIREDYATHKWAYSLADLILIQTEDDLIKLGFVSLDIPETNIFISYSGKLPAAKISPFTSITIATPAFPLKSC